MGRSRRRVRQDVVHAPIVEGLQRHGIICYNMPDPGDVLCYGESSSGFWIWMPMELKSGNDVRKKKADGQDEMTPRQKALRAKRSQAPIPIVHTLAEGLALFGKKETV